MAQGTTGERSMEQGSTWAMWRSIVVLALMAGALILIYGLAGNA